MLDFGPEPDLAGDTEDRGLSSMRPFILKPKPEPEPPPLSLTYAVLPQRLISAPLARLAWVTPRRLGDRRQAMTARDLSCSKPDLGGISIRYGVPTGRS